MRGYFDGDGWVTKEKFKKNLFWYKATKRSKSNKAFVLKKGLNKNRKKFITFFYRNANIYLKRKCDIFNFNAV